MTRSGSRRSSLKSEDFSGDESPKKRSRPGGSGSGKKLPHLNTFDVPEFMKGAQPGASAVQKAEFEDRCKLLWRKSQKEESQRIKEANRRAEWNMEAAVKELMEMFPVVEEQLVRDTLLQHDCNTQSAATVLIVLSGACEDQPPASSSTTRPKSPPRNVPKHDDLNEFPAMAPPRCDSKGWEVLPDFIKKEGDVAASSSWTDKAAGSPADWVDVNREVSLRERASSPTYRSSPKMRSPARSSNKSEDEDMMDIQDFEDEHDLRKGIGYKNRERHLAAAQAKIAAKKTKPPKSVTNPS